MQSEQHTLKPQLNYRKFASPPYRFLLLKYDYFLQVQLVAALRREGHEVVELEPPDPPSAEQVLRQILGQAAAFRPDALLTLNNLGLDQQGAIMTELSRYGLPVMIWYVDNYRFTGPYLPQGGADMAVAFSSDRALVPVLDRAGFAHAHYLPLAADVGYGAIRYDERYDFLRDKVSYVGGTFTKMVDHFHEEGHERLYLDWEPDFTAERLARKQVELDPVFAPFRQRFPDVQSFYRFMAYVVFRETRRYRVERLRSILELPLAVFGIDDWHNYLPQEVVHSPVAYFIETPNVYRNSAVNLSLATFQQEAALNQRLFDVPLCNGFVLSDWQEILADHFEPEREVITFRSDEELKDKVRYYLDHAEAREQITRRAQERILAEHLMEHRVVTMLRLTREALA